MGQRTFETRSLYLILAEKLLTLPAANEMLPLSVLFAGKYREVGMAAGILKARPQWTDYVMLARFLLPTLSSDASGGALTKAGSRHHAHPYTFPAGEAPGSSKSLP